MPWPFFTQADKIYSKLLPPIIQVDAHSLLSADRDMLDQLQPSIDTVANVPPCLTDLSTEASLLPEHFTWLSQLPALRRPQTLLARNLVITLPLLLLSALHELRLAFDSENRHWQRLAHCTQLRVLQLQSHRAIDSHRTTDSSINFGLDQLSTVLRASAATLETARLSIGNWLLEEKNRGSWAELAQCKQLRTLSLTLQPLAWETLLDALSQLPWFHTLGLFVEDNSMPALPTGLLRHMTKRAGSPWRTVQLQLLHPRCCMDLLSRKVSLDVLCPPAEAASEKAAQQVRFIVSKQGKPSRSYLITVDEHGQRKWQQM